MPEKKKNVFQIEELNYKHISIGGRLTGRSMLFVRGAWVNNKAKSKCKWETLRDKGALLKDQISRNLFNK